MSHLDTVRDTPLPDRMQHLARDERGYPIAWFAFTDAAGRHDFTRVDRDKVERAAKEDLCGICGLSHGYYRAIPGGPLTLVGRRSFDIPMHEECCRYALAICPFLALPSFGYIKRDGAWEIRAADVLTHAKPEALGLFITRKTTFAFLNRARTEWAFVAAPWVRTEWLRRPPTEEEMQRARTVAAEAERERRTQGRRYPRFYK